MPIYEYQCEQCDHRFETLQKMSDPVLTTCPACNQESLKKLISPVAFRLKGGGWYETDFKKDNKKQLANDEKGGSSAVDNSKTDGKSSDTSSSQPSSTSSDSSSSDTKKSTTTDSSNKS